MVRTWFVKTRRMFAAALVFLGLAGLLTPALSRAEDTHDVEKKAAIAAMETWLGQMDAADYAASWDNAGEAFRKAVTKEKWIEVSGNVRTPLGKLLSRQLDSAAWQAGPRSVGKSGGPEGTYVLAQFSTSFENMKTARETVTFEKGPDGSWREAGYFIKPN